ncbi:MAG: aminoacyl--tRNA ligase-related protein [Flavobacteriales bacterium]
MKYSKAFIYTERTPNEKLDATSHKLSIQAGLIHQVSAGLYDFLPLGNRVLQKIETVIREELNAIDCQEIAMPIVQPKELWIESGRWNVYGKEMLKFHNRDEREFCFGPTHEEVVIDLVRAKITSYKQFPFTLYQIGRKFRDEMRPKNGLLRGKEFMMKDAYSFHTSNEDLDREYKAFRTAYFKICERLGLKVIGIPADPGEIGGDGSEEVVAFSKFGEDYFIEEKGVATKIEENEVEKYSATHEVYRGIEVGHIFKLGTKYSSAMGFNFVNKEGKKEPVIMGCYGIGVSRMMNAILEQNNDKKGIVWPLAVAPYHLSIIPLKYKDSEFESVANNLEAAFNKAGVSTLLDDRDMGMGAKIKDSDLIGIPYKIIIGRRFTEAQEFELEIRKTGEKKLLVYKGEETIKEIAKEIHG